MRTSAETEFAAAIETPAHRTPATMRGDAASGAQLLTATLQQLAAWDSALAGLEFSESAPEILAALPAVRQQLGAMMRLLSQQQRDLRDFGTALRAFEELAAAVVAQLPPADGEPEGSP